jgi:hypothetical protein
MSVVPALENELEPFHKLRRVDLLTPVRFLRTLLCESHSKLPFRACRLSHRLPLSALLLRRPARCPPFLIVQPRDLGLNPRRRAIEQTSLSPATHRTLGPVSGLATGCKFFISRHCR